MVLFTDADTWHSPGALRATLMFRKRRSKLIFLTLERNRTSHLLGALMMPMVYFAFSFRYPIKFLNSSSSAVATANGQYILFQASL